MIVENWNWNFRKHLRSAQGKFSCPILFALHSLLKIFENAQGSLTLWHGCLSNGASVYKINKHILNLLWPTVFDFINFGHENFHMLMFSSAQPSLVYISITGRTIHRNPIKATYDISTLYIEPVARFSKFEQSLFEILKRVHIHICDPSSGSGLLSVCT